MNDRSLAEMLAELDAELARQNDPYRAARQVLTCLEARAPRAILGSAAGIELRQLGCTVAPQSWE